MHLSLYAVSSAKSQVITFQIAMYWSLIYNTKKVAMQIAAERHN